MQDELDKGALEKAVEAVEQQIDTCEAVLASPITLRRLRSQRVARAAVSAYLKAAAPSQEPDGMPGVERLALADEIERRRLKFADVVDGQYEMLSDYEHAMVVAAIRAIEGKR